MTSVKESISFYMEYLSSSVDKISWYASTSLIVYYYVIQFLPNLDKHDTFIATINRLNDIASQRKYLNVDLYQGKMLKPQQLHAIKFYMEQEVERIFINSFVPEVRRFFKVPKLMHLSEKDKCLRRNEILAGFLMFVLQVLDSELAFWSNNREKKCAILQKNLTFILTILGDSLFWCSGFKDVNSLLVQCESVVNESGDFVYSCVFVSEETRNMNFDAGIGAVLENIYAFLNEKLRKHSFKISKLPEIATIRSNPLHLSPFVADFLLEDLESFMNGRFGLMINDVDQDQIKTLVENLTFIHTILKDIQMPKVAHITELKKSMTQIWEVVYEAAYLINTFVMGHIPPWYLNLRLPDIVQKVKHNGKRVEEIVEKYDDIEGVNIHNSFSVGVSYYAVGDTEVVVDNTVIGFEDNRTKILADLVGGSEELKMISICGMAGIGKTTIAKKLFNDLAIREYFDLVAWCVVSQTYDRKKMLHDIWMSLAVVLGKEKVTQVKEENLDLGIYQSLLGKRYLIIMDDVWQSEMWDNMKFHFPDSGTGSRILLTSRVKDTAPTYSILYEPPFLTESQCYDLLVDKVFNKEPCPPELFGIANKIASKCHGLPLAVVVVAGILVNLEKEKNTWEKVEANMNSHMSDDVNRYRNILELSYEHLPDHLKPCYLYLGRFGVDEEVPMRKVIPLLMAEGFVHKKGEKSLKHVAEEYYSDMINRCLLMIAKRGSNGGIKACNIHDLLREMCLRKAQEENLLRHVKESSIYEQHSHLVVHMMPRETFAALHCRSLTGYLSSLVYQVTQMPLLRVIDELQVESSSSLYEIERICSLVHLKYLSFSVRDFPVGLCKLINLEYFHLDARCEVLVPSAILKMVKLRHVCITTEAIFEKCCDGAISTNNLKSLSCVRVRNEEESEILRCSSRLHKLKCICDGSLLPDLNFLAELESLTMKFTSPPKEVELTGGYFPSTIQKLSLYRTSLPWEKMTTVGNLPNLHVLKLFCCAFVGKEWETKENEFQKLRFLKICDVGLDQWITTKEHFPRLQCLVLEFVMDLVEIPSDLGHIPTLKTIDVRYCRYSIERSAVQIEKEQQLDYGNEDLKVIITSHKWSKDELVHQIEQNEEPMTENDDDDDANEIGLEPRDIEHVMNQAWVSRARAVKALKKAHGNVYYAFEEL